jgi:hypothetical protein
MKRTAPAVLAAVLLLLPLSLLAAGKFGAPLGDSPKVALSDLAKDPAAWAGKTVKTEGVVSAVCQEMGCWMVLKSGDQSVRVTFKDYGFFLPKDAAGMTAVMEGVFAPSAAAAGEGKHCDGEAADGKHDHAAHAEGMHAKADPKQLTFVASGVELAKPAR